jgi:tRNA(Ile)-lysidine synthase
VRGARPERDVERAIETGDVLRRGERVLIACSGGPDSIALLAATQALAKRIGVSTLAAFVNHGLRRSAWQDECVVLQVAAQFEVPLEVVALEGIARGEADLRTARYDALIEAAKRRRCDVVATAHHAQDQSETVILSLLRGAGSTGLSGMRARRPLTSSLTLARPLIGVAPETLRAYCHARALPYAVDPTNAQTDLRRNAVREALDALRPLFPGLDSAVARTAQLVAEEREGGRRAELRQTVRERLAADDELKDIDFLHVEAAVRALETGRSGTFLMKPGIALRIEAGTIEGITRK